MTFRRILRWTSGLALVVAAAAGGALWWWRVQLWTPSQNPALDLSIERGSSTSSVLTRLAEAGLMPSTGAGRLYLEVFGRDRVPQWGLYEIPAGARPADVLEMVLEGRVKPLVITVPEGSTTWEINDILTKAGITELDRWNDLVQQRTLVADIAPNAPSLEGFLFPDTYRFSTGVGAPTVVRTMVDHFRTVWTEARSGFPETPLNATDLITLASLVEAETGIAEERTRIAGVFVNRLRLGMPLQCDPTVVYALKRRGEWNGRLFRIHWKVDDPYNTYQYSGLPPGPINNPGRAAIRAAMHPESHRYLYFVADDAGGHVFSKTLREHNRAVARRKVGRR